MEAHRQKDRSKEPDSSFLLTNPSKNPVLPHTKPTRSCCVGNKIAASFANLKKYVNTSTSFGTNVGFLLLHQAVHVTTSVF
jgi:hypothetical protein